LQIILKLTYIYIDVIKYNDTSCISGIKGGASKEGILGDTFLRAYYSIYDFKNARVGFAQAVHP
jgi:hypothetical protein